MSEAKRRAVASKGARANTSEPPVETTDERLRQPSRLRRDGVRGERVSVYLPPELVVRLRVFCARERRSISDAVTEAVSAYLPRE